MEHLALLALPSIAEENDSDIGSEADMLERENRQTDDELEAGKSEQGESSCDSNIEPTGTFPASTNNTSQLHQFSETTNHMFSFIIKGKDHAKGSSRGPVMNKSLAGEKAKKSFKLTNSKVKRIEDVFQQE